MRASGRRDRKRPRKRSAPGLISNHVTRYGEGSYVECHTHHFRAARRLFFGHNHFLVGANAVGAGSDSVAGSIHAGSDAVDDTHRHFGNGQTEAMITLLPGKHSLQLVLGDWSHIARVPPVTSDVITVTVR